MRLDRKQIDEARIKLARICHLNSGSILVDEFGNFHIYQVPEQIKNNILHSLQFDSNYDNIYVSNGSYDFGHFNKFFEPTKKYTISGRLTGEKVLAESKESAWNKLDTDTKIDYIMHFFNTYKGTKFWEDLGEEFGDDAIDDALMMCDIGFFGKTKRDFPFDKEKDSDLVK